MNNQNKTKMFVTITEEEYNRRFEEKRAKYESKMKTPNDMIIFALTHSIFGEDCDLPAKEAYKNRMKHFNINIPKI